MNEFLKGFEAHLDTWAGDRTSIRSVVDKLAWRAQKAKDLPLVLPTVTLSLTTGRDIHGIILSMNERDREPIVIVGAVSQGRHLSFVPVHSILSITIHDVDDLARPPRGTEVPGKLDLQRRAQGIGARVGLELSVEAGEGEGARVAVGLLLAMLEPILDGIVVDDEGKAAIGRVKALRVRGETVHLDRTDDVITIGAVSVDDLPVAARLKADLEKLL